MNKKENRENQQMRDAARGQHNPNTQLIICFACYYIIIMIKRGQGGGGTFPTFVCCSLLNFVSYCEKSNERPGRKQNKRKGQVYSLHFVLFLNLFLTKYKV